MQGTGSGPSSNPNGAQNGAEALPTSEKVQEYFETQWYPFVYKFVEVRDTVALPEGYTQWSAVPAAELLKVKLNLFSFDVPVINPLYNPITAAAAAAARQDFVLGNTEVGVPQFSTIGEHWEKVLKAYLNTHNVEEGSTEETRIRAQAQAVLNRLLQEMRARFLEHEKLYLVSSIRPETDPNTLQTAYEGMINGYIAADSTLDADQVRAEQTQDIQEQIFLARQRQALGERILSGEITGDPETVIRDSVAEFIASIPSTLPEEEKAEIEAKLVLELTKLYENLTASVEHRREREQYFSDALMRFRKLQKENPDIRHEEKEDMWREVIRIYVHGGSYTDYQGNPREFPAPGNPREREGYVNEAQQLFNQYIASQKTFREYMRVSRVNHAFSGFDDPIREGRAAEAYAQEQKEFLSLASTVQIQAQGLLTLDTVNSLEQDYRLLPFLERPENLGLKEHESVTNFITFCGSLESYAERIGNATDETEVGQIYDEIQAKSFDALSTMAALRRIQRKGENPGLSDAEIEAELVQDIQGIGQQWSYFWGNAFGHAGENLTPDSVGGGFNKFGSFMLNWNMMTLGIASIDKMGARHREHAFSRHWHFPGVPHLGRFTTWATLAFAAGHEAGLNPVGRTARLVWDGVQRDFRTLGGIADAAGRLGSLDFTQDYWGLTGSGLALGRSADSITSPLRALGIDIPTIGDGVFGDDKQIENPAVAANFLEDKKLAELVKLAGEVLELNREIERLQKEIEIAQRNLEAAKAETPVDPAKVSGFQTEIDTKTQALTQHTQDLAPKYQELFVNQENKQRIMMFLAWDEVVYGGLNGSETRADGTMDLDKHGQAKIWTVVEDAFRSAHALYTGGLGESELREMIDEYRDYLEEPNPDDPSGRGMRRTEFMRDYAAFLIGGASSDDLQALKAKYPGNPFLPLAEGGIPFNPSVDRRLLAHHVTAHNIAENDGLFHSLMRSTIGNPAKFVGILVAFGFIVKQIRTGNKAWKAAMWATFPTIAATTALVGRLFQAHEDSPNDPETNENDGGNMLDEPPNNRNALMRIIFEDPNNPNKRKRKDDNLNLVDFVKEMQKGPMMTVPETELIKKLEDASKNANKRRGMKSMDPKNFKGKLDNLIATLENPNSGTKAIYQALKDDLLAAAQETDPVDPNKTNPLQVIIGGVYDQEQVFVDIHTGVGQLVSLTQNREVKQVEVTVRFDGSGDNSETFLMRVGSGKNKRKNFKDWWNKDNNDQYHEGRGTEFAARATGATADAFEDFQIYYDDGEGSFMMRHGSSTPRKITSISAVRRLESS